MSSSPDDLIDFFAVTDPSEAVHVKAALDGAGIPWLVRNEGVQNLFGVGTLGTGYDIVTGPPIIMVPADRLDDARKALEQALAEEPDADAPG